MNLLLVCKLKKSNSYFSVYNKFYLVTTGDVDLLIFPKESNKVEKDFALCYNT